MKRIFGKCRSASDHTPKARRLDRKNLIFTRIHAMSVIAESFGCMVFNDAVMKARLPKETYNTLQKTIRDGRHLDINVANVVANAMKDWAIEHGATHYTHWFQPMTGMTAEKHDSFISPTENSRVIMEFSGKELVRGESDASSFPSGGLRATFEARGYTAWDPNSYAFLKEGTLCIPTAFCSYGGEALDKKTPLLRSMEAIERQTMRILKLFGNTTVTRATTTVGAEQEYFLVDKAVFERRPDLFYCGRTLFGSPPPKGQQLNDHYFGSIKARVAEFMKELDLELWKLGILAKTEHNEAAPAQHELAPIYTATNIATDHNQLTMELMQKIAKRHGMACLLHEKPFEGVNGSGKHNNWSISTNTGANLFEPGETPYENAQFLLFLCAVIKAADDYQELFRISVASAGNDHRLGASEAPPAVVSLFLGDELMDILTAIEKDDSYDAKEKTVMKIGVHTLPRFPKDTTDRNRTSPFAFTGNKFEFRMTGSAASIAETNIVINTTVAESLRQFADELDGAENFNLALHDLIKRTIKKHRRILFSGNGYGEEWLQEAQARGLANYPSTPDALAHYLDRKNVELFKTHKVFSEAEMRARAEIILENYCKIINIEAKTMLEMVKRDILPAVSSFAADLAVNAQNKLAIDLPADYELDTAKEVSVATSKLSASCKKLDAALAEENSMRDTATVAAFCKDTVLSLMRELRTSADSLETITSREYWPFPSYGEILFSIS